MVHLHRSLLLILIQCKATETQQFLVFQLSYFQGNKLLFILPSIISISLSSLPCSYLFWPNMALVFVSHSYYFLHWCLYRGLASRHHQLWEPLHCQEGFSWVFIAVCECMICKVMGRKCLPICHLHLNYCSLFNNLWNRWWQTEMDSSFCLWCPGQVHSQEINVWRWRRMKFWPD